MMRSTSRTHVALAGWASAFERHHMIEIAPAGRRRTPWIRAALIARQNQVDEPPVRAVATGRRGCVAGRITTRVFGQIALSRVWWIDHDDPISVRGDSSSLVSRYRAVAHKQSRILASSLQRGIRHRDDHLRAPALLQGRRRAPPAENLTRFHCCKTELVHPAPTRILMSVHSLIQFPPCRISLVGTCGHSFGVPDHARMQPSSCTPDRVRIASDVSAI